MSRRRHDHFLTRPARPATCRTCRALVLDGLAEGIPARVDPDSLNRAGELAAILANRATYALTPGGLVLRDEHHTRHPPGAILAEHRCGAVVDAEHRALPSSHSTYVIPVEPPY